MIVSTRIKSYNKKKYIYHVHHDLRKSIPSYVDKDRLNKNRVYSFVDSDVEEFIEREWFKVRADFLEHNNRQLRSDTGIIIEGIITFSKESRDFVNNDQNWEELDKRAIEFVKNLEQIWNSKAIYVVRHSDETTTHYHYALMNYDYKNHRTIRARLKKKDTSQLQDIVADVFSDLGFKRGKHLAQRIQEGDENTWNWGNVAQIHQRMLEEIELMRKEKEELENDISKYEELARKKKEKMQNIQEELEKKRREKEIIDEEIEEIEKKIEKAKKTLSTYEKRIIDKEERLKELDDQISEREKVLNQILENSESKDEAREETKKIIKNILSNIDIEYIEHKDKKYVSVKSFNKFINNISDYFANLSEKIREVRKIEKESFDIIRKREKIINDAKFEAEKVFEKTLREYENKLKDLEYVKRLEIENGQLRVENDLLKDKIREFERSKRLKY